MIQDYGFGRIQIDGKTYTSDVIIYPDHVDGSWWRKEGHSLCVDDLKEVLETAPEVLVIGCGAMNVLRVPKEAQAEIESRGIELIAQPTAQACDTYNELAKTVRNVIAGLHLTC